MNNLPCDCISGKIYLQDKDVDYSCKIETMEFPCVFCNSLVFNTHQHPLYRESQYECNSCHKYIAYFRDDESFPHLEEYFVFENDINKFVSIFK